VATLRNSLNSGRRSIHRLLLLIGIISLGVWLAFDRHQLHQFFHILSRIRWYYLVLIIALQIVSYIVNAYYYRSIVRALGFKLTVYRCFGGALASNFANFILPSAGFAGAGFLSQVFKPEVPRGIGMLTQYVRYVFSTFATLIFMPLGVVLVLANRSHSAEAYGVISSAAICVACIALLIIGVVVLLRNESTFKRSVWWLSIKLGKWVSSGQKRSTQELIDEFYDGVGVVRRNVRALSVPAAWSIAYILISLGMLYMIFPALGSYASPGTVIMAYLLATIVSVFGGEFISTGVFEVGMSTTLVALGEPFALAVSATILYKFLNLCIGLPLGFYYYDRYLPE